MISLATAICLATAAALSPGTRQRAASEARQVRGQHLVRVRGIERAPIDKLSVDILEAGVEA